MPYKNPEDKRRWRDRNRESNAVYLAEWKKRNPDLVAKHQSRVLARQKETRLAKRLGLSIRTHGGPIFYSKRKQSLKNYSPTCQRARPADWRGSLWRVAMRANQKLSDIGDSSEERISQAVARSLRLMSERGLRHGRSRRVFCVDWGQAFDRVAIQVTVEFYRARLSSWDRKFARIAHNIWLRRGHHGIAEGAGQGD